MTSRGGHGKKGLGGYGWCTNYLVQTREKRMKGERELSLKIFIRIFLQILVYGTEVFVEII